jgi:hypothetical protein
MSKQVIKDLKMQFHSNGFFRIAANGKRLCAGGDLEHESFNSAQKPIRNTTVEFSNSAPLAQNRCYAQCFLGVQNSNF